MFSTLLSHLWIPRHPTFSRTGRDLYDKNGTPPPGGKGRRLGGGPRRGHGGCVCGPLWSGPPRYLSLNTEDMLYIGSIHPSVRPSVRPFIDLSSYILSYVVFPILFLF